MTRNLAKQLLFIFPFLSLLLTSCCPSNVMTMLNKVNKNSNFDFNIGVKVDSINWKNYPDFVKTPYPYFCEACGEDYISGDGKTIYGTNGVPDISEPLAISSFSTTDEQYYIYDYQIGSETESIKSFFTALGFTYMAFSPDVEGGPTTHRIRYSNEEEDENKKESLEIVFGSYETIYYMSVSFISSNKKGIV